MQQVVYKIARVFAKVGVFLIAFLSFVGAVVVVLTQYEPFRQWAIGKGLEAINESLAGRLEVKDIEGNFITGLTVRDAHLIAGDSTFIFVPRIELHYSLRPFFEARHITATAVLHNPRIHLIRNAAGVWNFTQIARPPTDTTYKPRTPLTWVFDVRDLEIRDATVTIHDAFTPRVDSANQLDFLHSTFDHLNVGLNAFVSEDEQNVSIDNLSFVMRDTPFRMVELAGSIALDEDGLQVDGLRMETGESYLQLDLAMDSLRLFDTAFAASILRNRFEIDLDGERIDTKELRMFVPAVNFLGGDASIQLEASGTFDDMNVEKLEVNLTHSVIKAKGRLQNLRDPENFRIESGITESKLTYEDVPIHIPGLPIPNLQYLGVLEMKTLSYSGTRRDLTTVFDLSSDIGKIQGGGWFDYGGELPAWRVDAVVSELDISPIVDDALFKGKVNARIVADGRGFEPSKMTAKAKIKAGASEVGGRRLARLWFDGGIANGGIITADTLMLAWGNPSDGSALESLAIDELQRVLEAGRAGKGAGFMNRLRYSNVDAAIFDGLPSARVGGWYDMRNADHPRYQLAISTDRLNVADITLDPEHTTRLGLTLTVDGEGLDPDRMTGKVVLDVTDALLPGGEELRPFKAELSMGYTPEKERLLNLTSTMLDARLQGEWRFASLVPALSSGFDRLISYISRKQSYRSDEFSFFDDDQAAGRAIQVEYQFTPKDLSIAESFLKGAKLEMDASLTGRISGTSGLLGMTSRGEIRRLRYETATDTLNLQSTHIDINIDNISATSMDELLDAEVNITSDSLILYNDMSLALPKFNLRFVDGVLRANGVATLNNEYSLAIDGSLDVSAPEGYLVEIDTLIFGMSRELQWRNVSGKKIRLVLSDDRLAIQEFQLYRRGAEAISVTGGLVGYERFQNLRVSVTALPLQELRPFVMEAETLTMIETLNGTLRDMTVTLNGTFDDPIIQGTVDIDALSYTTIPIGDLDIEIDYKSQNLKGSIVVRRPLTSTSNDGVPLAQVDIETMPIDLAFASREERFVSGRPVRITAKTVDLPIAIAGPFSTGLLLQQGTADLDFAISGVYPNLSYTGSGSVTNGLIAVEATNVSYVVNAKFEFRDRILNVDGLRIENLPGDNPGGHAIANGRIEFDGFTPKTFNINIKTPNPERGILLLSDATQAVNENIYGDLVIATTSSGDAISFSGSLDNPVLIGNITVLSASLTVPYRETSASSSQNIEFIDYDVWQERQSRQQGPLLSDSLKKEFGIPTAEEIELQNRNREDADRLDEVFDLERRRRDSLASVAGEGSFADNLDIRMQLTLTDRVFVRIQLGPLQELALNLELKDPKDPLDFAMKGDNITLSGFVALAEGSRFVYLKTFDATGTVSFDRDISNPVLSIQGVYEGRRFINERSEDYTVNVDVTGPLDQLNIDFSYTVNGVAAQEDNEEQRRINAVFLLLFGRRSDENLGSNALEGLVEQSSSSVGTSAVNAAISELIRNIEFIQALEIDLGQATDLGQARVNLVGQLGKTLVRYNGRVSTPEDGTISIEVPFSVLGDAEVLKALVAELQREVVDQFGGMAQNSLTSTQGEVYRLRLRFRTTF